MTDKNASSYVEDEEAEVEEEHKDKDFFWAIGDAYCFRSLLDFLSGSLQDVSWMICPNMIRLCEKNAEETVMHRVVLQTGVLVDFFLSPEIDVYRLSMNLKTVKGSVNVTHKKMGQICLFNNNKSPDKDTECFGTFCDQGDKKDTCIRIPLIKMPEDAEDEEMDESLFNYPEVVDNVNEFMITMYASEVSNTVNKIGKLKCDYAELQCYRRGFLVAGFQNGKDVSSDPMGKCIDPLTSSADIVERKNGRMINKYVISAEILKSFGKIDNIAGETATIRVYFSTPTRNKNLKIMFPCSTVGYVSPSSSPRIRPRAPAPPRPPRRAKSPKRSKNKKNFFFTKFYFFLPHKKKDHRKKKCLAVQSPVLRPARPSRSSTSSSFSNPPSTAP